MVAGAVCQDVPDAAAIEAALAAFDGFWVPYIKLLFRIFDAIGNYFTFPRHSIC